MVKEMFKKPKWLKPEINEFKYWVHLGVLATVALGILQLWKGGDMLTVSNVLYSIPILAAGDVVAHTVLGLD